jgi:hypothetical protein
MDEVDHVGSYLKDNKMAWYPVCHPGEGRDPGNVSLDSGLRRKDHRGERMSLNFADVKL